MVPHPTARHTRRVARQTDSYRMAPSQTGVRNSRHERIARYRDTSARSPVDLNRGRSGRIEISALCRRGANGSRDTSRHPVRLMRRRDASATTLAERRLSRWRVCAMAAPVPHNLTGLSDQAGFRQVRQSCASSERCRAYRIVSTASISVGEVSARRPRRYESRPGEDRCECTARRAGARNVMAVRGFSAPIPSVISEFDPLAPLAGRG
jgi:hypothetical protein